MTSPRDDLLRIIYGYRASQCVYAAAVLGVYEHLAKAPAAPGEIAAKIDADPEAVRRLLRALVELKLLVEDGEGRCGLTPMSRFLLKDSKGSVRAEAIHALHPTSWESWGRLDESVRTGLPSFPGLFERPVWEYRANDPEAAAAFDAMAEERSREDAEFVLRNLDVEAARRVVDVGGGTGRMMISLLTRWQTLRGVILERPEVVPRTTRAMEDAGLSDRCAVEAGDFFEGVPGGDLIVLKAILHNWDDDHAYRILSRCRESLSPGGRLAIVESLADEPSTNGWMDLHMLVVHGGRERTRAEYAALLERAGLLISAVHLGRGRALMEARTELCLHETKGQ